jgi:hypothetical protein
MVTLEAADRNARPPLSADERRGYHLAFFALSAAVNDAGFHVLAPGAGRLEVHPPDGMAREVSAPIADALEAHKADIIDLLRWLGAEARRGILWVPPERGPAQCAAAPATWPP